MTLKERINALVKLGEELASRDEQLEAVIHTSYIHNPWFTKENTNKAISGIVTKMLQNNLLSDWLAKYDLKDAPKSQTIGLVLAGNIPMVGFHDLLCVFVAGHKSKIKLSDKDRFLIPHFIERLATIDSRTSAYFEEIDRLKDFDAVIATGSNNTARYFEQYFAKYPNIIRRNRNGIAVMSGSETEEELKAFGEDVFRYFGLGCRNVSKLYLPKGYGFEPLLEALHEYRELAHHNKYKNNFDYNYTLLILNQIPYEANGCILMTEDQAIQSRIASLHYEYYENEESLEKELVEKKEEIQCVVSKMEFSKVPTISFGQAQNPRLDDYADGVDTLDFLMTL